MGVSLSKSTTDDWQVQKVVFVHFYAYLVSYATWIGAQHEKFSFGDSVTFGRKAIENLPPDKFPQSGISRHVADALASFY